MNFLDIFILLILFYGLFSGYKKGLVKEIGFLAALFFGVYLGLYHNDIFKTFLVNLDMGLDGYVDIVSIILTFLATFLVIYYAAIILTKILKTIFLGWLNKILGGVVGIVKMAFILSIFLFFFNKLNDEFTLVDKKYLSKSRFFYPIKNILPSIYPQAQEIKLI